MNGTLTVNLSKDKFREVIKNTPLFSIDLVIVNNKNEILLGLRNNAPAQGFWFVPGGRVYKDELLEKGFERICSSEIGVAKSLKDTEFLGIYEHIYENNFFDSSFSTHYIVMGLKLKLDLMTSELSKEQHLKYKWWKQDELMASEDVHQNTKNYFIKEEGIL